MQVNIKPEKEDNNDIFTKSPNPTTVKRRRVKKKTRKIGENIKKIYVQFRDCQYVILKVDKAFLVQSTREAVNDMSSNSPGSKGTTKLEEKTRRIHRSRERMCYNTQLHELGNSHKIESPQN